MPNPIPMQQTSMQTCDPIFRLACAHAPQSLILIDAKMTVRYANGSALALWGVTAEQCAGAPPFREFMCNGLAADISGDDLEKFVLDCFALVQSADSLPVDLRLPDGRVVRGRCTMLPEGWRLLTHADVTDLVLRAEAFQRLADVDPLTGLPNKSEFLRQADAEWHRFRRYHRAFSIVTFEIADLSAIMVRYGSEVSDRVILHVTTACLREKRTPDVLARLGANRFAVLMPCTTREGARAFALRLRTAVRCHPLYLHEHPLRLSINAGVAESEANMSGIATLFTTAAHELLAPRPVAKISRARQRATTMRSPVSERS